MMLLLQGLFRLVLSLSLAGGFATLLVMGARVLARDRLGPRWDRYGWMLPLALYLVPVILPRTAPAQQGAAVQAAGDTTGSVSAAVGGQAPAMASLWEGLMAFCPLEGLAQSPSPMLPHGKQVARPILTLWVQLTCALTIRITSTVLLRQTFS